MSRLSADGVRDGGAVTADSIVIISVAGVCRRVVQQMSVRYRLLPPPPLASWALSSILFYLLFFLDSEEALS